MPSPHLEAGEDCNLLNKVLFCVKSQSKAGKPWFDFPDNLNPRIISLRAGILSLDFLKRNSCPPPAHQPEALPFLPKRWSLLKVVPHKLFPFLSPLSLRYTGELRRFSFQQFPNSLLAGQLRTFLSRRHFEVACQGISPTSSV